jgi:UDP-N-acetylmuramoyl-L-alanyl-D-glutamate--2,6-diaminopimelate ligase
VQKNQPKILPVTKITLSADQCLNTLKGAGQFKDSNLPIRADLDRAALRMLVHDSRTVTTGAIFIAIKGTKFDPHQELPKEVRANAAFLIIQELTASIKKSKLPYILVENTRAAWAHLCAAAFDHPQKKISLIGVTGTNGKTSSVWYTRQLMMQINIPCLTIGTLGAFFPDEEYITTHTTPDPPVFYTLLSMAVAKDIKYVVMEVSSHAIYQEKLAPCEFACVGFTSFTRDHLDLHGSMEAYLNEKIRLLTELRNPSAPIFLSASLADSLGAILRAHTDHTACAIYGFGADHVARTHNIKRFVNIESTSGSNRSSHILVKNEQGITKQFDLPLVGHVALENFALAASMVHHLTNADLSDDQCGKLASVPGRLELVASDKPDEPRVVVDYAHTPDALEKVIEILRPLTSGNFYVIVGCGGDRDPGKRPMMGKIACTLADQAVFTSDNPRSEAPEKIIDDMLAGVSECDAKPLVECDRAKAIALVIAKAKSGDTVLIAGKGHEDYQEIKGVKHPFDDRLVALNCLRKR